MIKVLIAEDSPVMQELLIYTISVDPDFEIVGVVSDGEQAVNSVIKLKPDIVAMDFHMPKIDGKEATKIIMETCPTPIVIVTGSLAVKDVLFTFSMLEVGAVAIVKKPHSIDHPEYSTESKELIKTLKLMSEVKLVKRVKSFTQKSAVSDTKIERLINEESSIQLVAIGASTGGPIVLQKILSGLPKKFPVPILIVQHISSGFTKGFIEWLNDTTSFPCRIASHGLQLLPGHAYIAPDDFQMAVEEGPKIILSKNGFENNLRPSVSYLFRSVAQVFGSRATAVLLSGMGRDGADELKFLRDKGAVTFVQNKESCVVYGMPGEAVKIGAATHILSPEEITQALIVLINKMNRVDL